MVGRSAKSLIWAALAFPLLLGGCGAASTSPATPTTTLAPASPFAGAYLGTYAGSEKGSWTGTIGPDGSMTVTVSSPSVGAFGGTGTVAATGEIAVSAVGGGFTTTWRGRFQEQSGGSVTGSGTWSSTSGFSGTWAGNRR